MTNESGNIQDPRKIVVKARSIDEIFEILGIEQYDGETSRGTTFDGDEDLVIVLETLADIYEGVKIATEEDTRGRSRKMVRQYAGREDIESEVVGSLLRVLAAHGLVVQDGHRWRVAEEKRE